MFIISIMATSAFPLRDAFSSGEWRGLNENVAFLSTSAGISAPRLLPISPNPNSRGNITITWNSVPDAVWYNVYESSFPILTENRTGLRQEASYFFIGTTFTTYESNGMHYYVVTALKWINWTCMESSFSNCESVLVSSTMLPTAPVLTTINSNVIHDRDISLAWSPVNNVAGYHVHESMMPINSSNFANTSCLTVPASQTAYTTCRPCNGTYFFAVDAFNGLGCSEVSNCLGIQVILFAPRAPVLYPITPNPNAVGNVTLSWSAVSGADYYEIYMDSQPIPRPPINITLPGNSTINVTISYFPDPSTIQYSPCPPCLPWLPVLSSYSVETTYTSICNNGITYFAVVALNESGWSGYSNCESILVNATAPASAPVLSLLGPNPSNSSRTSLSWSAVPDALRYYVYENRFPINDSNIYQAKCIGVDINLQTTYFDNYRQNGTYYYAVAAWNAGGLSPVSNCIRVDVVLNPIKVNSYIGVKPGDAYLFKATCHGNTKFIANPSNGTYNIVVVVDSVTDYGRGADITYHEVYSDATNASIQARSCTTIIGAEDIAVDNFWSVDWFINKNMANKSLHYSNPPSYPNFPYIGIFYFAGPSINATWDGSGILVNATESWSGDPSTSLSYELVGAVTTPIAPRNVQISSAAHKVNLSWHEPASNGGLPITGYKIFRGTSSHNETFLANVGNVTSYTDTNVTNGITYFYTMSAVNNAGDRDQSIEVNATPMTIPSMPQALEASAGDGQTKLSWQAPADNGGAVIIGYKIFRGTEQENETLFAIIGNDTVFTDTNVVNGNAYYYLICAINYAGDGIQSNQAKAMPVAADHAPLVFFCVISCIVGMTIITVMSQKYMEKKTSHLTHPDLGLTPYNDIKCAILQRIYIPIIQETIILDRQENISNPQPPMKLKCLVHKGDIVKGHHVTCTHCGAIYCEGCFKELVFCGELCWSCGALLG